MLCKKCNVSESVAMLEVALSFRTASNQNTRITCILNQLYSDDCSILTVNDITKNDRTYPNITKLVKKHYIKKADSSYLPTRYKITLLGKCRVLCNQFGIRFLELCILTEAYTIHKYQKQNKCRSFYVLLDINDYFEWFYTVKTIRNYAAMLCSKKFVYSMSNNMIRIRDEAMLKLLPHDRTFQQIHEWITSIPNQLDHLKMYDPETLYRIQNVRYRHAGDS